MGAQQAGRSRTAEAMASHHRRTRADHSRELAEDYVELIDELIRLTGEARAVDIARRLGVTHVTVAKTVARLQRDGLVRSAPYRSIFLTDSGRKLAEKSRARHDVEVRFLQALGVPLADAETDAEGIEHHLSQATLRAMKRFVDQGSA
jgi:DtxR family manganese transport transcriptional regulator